MNAVMNLQVLYNAVNVACLYETTQEFGGPGSSFGIANVCWLDGPGSNPGGDEIFRPSRPSLGPTQPPVEMGTVSFLGVKCGRGVLLTTHPLLVPRSSRIYGVILHFLYL